MHQAIQRIFFLSMAIVISGCASPQSNVIDNTASLEDISTVSSENNWPPDIPLYAGSYIRFSNEKNVAGKNSAVLFSSDSLKTIQNYYTTTLKDQGWTSVSTLIIESNTIYRFTKDNRTLLMNIRGKDGSVTIALGVTMEP